jgi:hypothetical protein
MGLGGRRLGLGEIELGHLGEVGAADEGLVAGAGDDDARTDRSWRRLVMISTKRSLPARPSALRFSGC